MMSNYGLGAAGTTATAPEGEAEADVLHTPSMEVNYITEQFLFNCSKRASLCINSAKNLI